MYKEDHTTDKNPYGDFQCRGGKVLFQRIGAMNAQRQNNCRAPTGRGIWAFPWPIFEYFYVSASYSSPNVKRPSNCYDDKGDYVYRPISKKELIQVKKRMKGLQRHLEQVEAKGLNNSFVDKFDVMQLKEDIAEMQKALDTGSIAKMIWWDHFKCHTVPEVKKRLIWWGGDIYSRFGPKGFADPCMDSRGWYLWTNPKDYVKCLRKHLIGYHTDEYFKKEGKVCTLAVEGIKSSKREFNMSADHLEVFLGM